MRVFCFSALLLLPMLVFSAISEIETARDDILETRKRRAQQLEIILNDAKARLHDHNSKHKLLADDERISLERKLELYTRKYEMLQKIPDELEIERLLFREKVRDERVKERREKLEQAGRRFSPEEEL